MNEEPRVERAPPRRRRVLRFAIFFILFAGLAAWFSWKTYVARRPPENIVSLSGRIEGDDSAIAPKTGGRVLEIRFREGDTVHSGDTIAIIDDKQVQAREDQARAAVRDAEAMVKSARDRIAVLQEQWRQNQLQTEQAKIDAQGRVLEAEADLATADAELAAQEAAYQIAEFDKEAYTRLAKTGAVSERQGKQAHSAAAQQEAAVAAARRRVEAAQGALTVAEANLKNPIIRSAEMAAVEQQMAQQEAEVAGAMARAEQARAQLREAEANREDLIVKAPFSGTIATRVAEPGEVLSAGTPVVTLVDLTKVYLRGFVAEGQIGKIKVGQPARVYLDSDPDRPIPAYVSRIDPAATFTPENTYFKDERVKQVVGVKLQLEGADGYAKPGMPADGEILIHGHEWSKTAHRKR